MQIAKFQYKCRLCGKIYNDSCTSEENARIVLISTVVGVPMPKKMIGIQPELIDIHFDCKIGHGISDLVGYIVEDE